MTLTLKYNLFMISRRHALKSSMALLGLGKIDFVEFRKSFDAVDYEGWIMIEGAIPKNENMLESYIHNNKYLRSILKT